MLKEVDHIQLLPRRKKNSKRALPPYIVLVQRYHRKRVETAGSLIEQPLPKSIHAVTPQGFELKAALFIISSSLNCYLNLSIGSNIFGVGQLSAAKWYTTAQFIKVCSRPIAPATT